MNCWHCKSELIWCGDHDVGHEFEDYSMLTELHCPSCDSDYEVFYPKEKDKDD